jgi:hypothetical protein
MIDCSFLKPPLTPTRENLQRENLQETVINNAISDFLIYNDFFKRDSVFKVNFKDSIFYESVNERNSKAKSTHERKQDLLYDEIISVEIAACYYQHYYSEGSKGTLPSMYVVKDGKLFYWWDENYPVTEEIISILRKYNLLQTDLIIPDFSTNDDHKRKHYYFCKNDLSIYKRVITKVSLGNYKPPQLKCK